MARLLTVDSLVAQVKSLIDEDNPDSVDEKLDILPSLNRAQDYAWDILSRHYEDPLLSVEPLTLNGTDQDYDLPEDMYSDRIEKVEITVNRTQYEVQRISYRDASAFESRVKTNIPTYYSIVGKKIRFYPTPSGTYSARVWYIKEPDELVLAQGRVVGSGLPTTEHITLSEVGPDLTTVSDELNNYVNIINGHTGEVKATVQVAEVDTDNNRIKIKSTPDRNSVLNRDVSGTLAGSGIEADDYISVARGTCVPLFNKPTANFMVQYAVAEMLRKLNGEAGAAEQVLKKFEQQVERTWAGREQKLRVKKRSRNWDVPFRRWYYLDE